MGTANWLECRPERKVLAIVGLPGVGKTTLFEALRASDLRGISFLPGQAALTEDELRQLKALDAAREPDDLRTWDFYKYQSVFLGAKARRVEEMLQYTDSSGYVVVDRPVEDPIFATETLDKKGLLDSAESLRRLFYPSLVRMRSSAVILLEADPATIQARLTLRGEGATSRDDYLRIYGAHYAPWFMQNIRSVYSLKTDSLTVQEIVTSATRIVMKCAERN